MAFIRSVLCEVEWERSSSSISHTTYLCLVVWMLLRVELMHMEEEVETCVGFL